jgi:hypothetical protein
MLDGNLTWQPHREPFHIALIRNGIISLVVGAVLAPWMGGITHWPIAALLVFWPAFGGHLVELWFLNWLRPRLPVARAVQVGSRVAVWFIGGIMLALGMRLTAMAVMGISRARWPAWWFGGIAFIVVELAVHLVMQLRGLPSFYDGRS